MGHEDDHHDESEHEDDHGDLEDHEMDDDYAMEHDEDDHEDAEDHDGDDEQDEMILLTDADSTPRTLSEHKFAFLGAAGLVTFVTGMAVSLKRRSAAVSDPTFEMGERC